MMSKFWYRIQLGAIALLGAVAWVGVYIILYKNSFGIDLQCAYENYHPTGLAFECMQRLENLRALHTGLFLKALIIIPLVLMFFPERVYKWWRWTVLIGVPYIFWDLSKSTSVISETYFPPAAMTNIYGFLSISVSVTIVTGALLFGKIHEHQFAKPVYLYSSYVLAFLSSLGLGAVTLWAIWH